MYYMPLAASQANLLLTSPHSEAGISQQAMELATSMQFCSITDLPLLPVQESRQWWNALACCNSCWTHDCCGGLNAIGPQKLTGRGTIRKCGFVGVCIALLEQVCHCKGVSEVSCAQAIPCDTVHFLLLEDQDVDVSAPSPTPCLPTCCHVLSWW